MKKYIFLAICILSVNFGFSQDKKEEVDLSKIKESALNGMTDKACKCIDSISTYNQTKDSVASKIGNCIDKEVVSYQLFSKMKLIIGKDKQEKNEVIELNTNKNSNQYKEYFYEIERDLMEKCPAIKQKIAENDIIQNNSISKNEEALKYYNLGIKENKAENFEKAIEYYQKAVAVDHNFAFAYDNIGICYRQLGKYDEAIDAYEKSLKINPNGETPLQNIAVAYSYKKQYNKAVNAYEKLSKIDKNNPEIYYGIGQIYASYLNDYEKALQNMCKAYNIYAEQKSPYRTDAEKIIQIIYQAMKKDGKEEKFKEILKENHISSN